ncbi:MAG TPA: DNA-3-methyladenine glycosylase I [Verrucomicrobiales bacterium]|nr:DNA-3-methyladenine glycosylase I [Verrucomicrobiales bacterium]
MAQKHRPVVRCPWSETGPCCIAYHDEEWGVPLHDDRRLFEMLILEGAQAGLSWITILRRRESYREAFAQFDPGKIARFTPRTIERLLQNPGIIRNRLKVQAAIQNARALLALLDAYPSLDAYLWAFVDGSPVRNRWRSQEEIPARTELSDRLSRDLRQRGFTFVGPTIVYAFMQATGMVNDHLVSCFRYKQICS